MQTLEQIKETMLTPFKGSITNEEHDMWNALLETDPKDLFDALNGEMFCSEKDYHFLGFCKATYPAHGMFGIRTMAMVFEDQENFSKFWFHISTQNVGYSWEDCGLSRDEVAKKFLTDFGLVVDGWNRSEEEAASEDEVIEQLAKNRELKEKSKRKFGK